MVVGRRCCPFYFSTGLNYLGNDGRVPSKRKSLECGYDSRLLRPRRYRRSGSLDVHESYRLGD